MASGQNQGQAQLLKAARFALLAAIVVLALGTVLWLALGRPGSPSLHYKQEIARLPSLPPFQAVMVDLRQPSSPKGEGGLETGRPALAIPRGRLRVTFLLPVGNEEGQYEVQLLAGNGHPVLLFRGARIVSYVTTLETEADLRELDPGIYTLRIGRPGRLAGLFGRAGVISRGGAAQ